MSGSFRTFEIVPRGLTGDPHQAKLEQLAEKWSPYRMWVCVCLRRTLEGGASMTHSRAAQ